MDKPPASQAVIDEVLPPDRASASTTASKAENDAKNESARILARWLDELITIPGTKIKIGLDPILSLFPALGDLLVSSAGLVIIGEAVRSRASVPVVLRMGANMLINALINAVPAIGPFASAFYKSNTRNITLLRQWQEGQREEASKKSRAFLLVLVAIFGGILLLWIALWIAILYFFLKPVMRLVHGE